MHVYSLPSECMHFSIFVLFFPKFVHSAISNIIELVIPGVFRKFKKKKVTFVVILFNMVSAYSWSDANPWDWSSRHALHSNVNNTCCFSSRSMSSSSGVFSTFYCVVRARKKMINFFHSKLNRCIFAYSTKITKSKWKRLHTYTPTHIHTHAARTFIKYYAYMTQSVSQQSFFFTCLCDSKHTECQTMYYDVCK